MNDMSKMLHASRNLQMIKPCHLCVVWGYGNYLSGQCFKRIRQGEKEKASGQASIQVSIGSPKKRMILQEH